MKKSISKRIKITKRGKTLRRAMGQGHNRAKQRTVKRKRRKILRGLLHSEKFLKKHL